MITEKRTHGESSMALVSPSFAFYFLPLKPTFISSLTLKIQFWWAKFWSQCRAFLLKKQLKAMPYNDHLVKDTCIIWVLNKKSLFSLAHEFFWLIKIVHCPPANLIPMNFKIYKDKSFIQSIKQDNNHDTYF